MAIMGMVVVEDGGEGGGGGGGKGIVGRASEKEGSELVVWLGTTLNWNFSTAKVVEVWLYGGHGPHDRSRCAK